MFWNNKKLKSIQQNLMNQQVTIESYIKQLSETDRNRIEWCTVHQRECKSTGLLMWEKDLNHRYIFLNTRHCNDFFRVSLAEVSKLIGKTDSELISDFSAKTGLQNTFADICVFTDKYTLKQNTICRFWEMGYIGENILILDVTKKPLIRDGKVVGTQSWALNNSKNECEVKALLELFLKNDQAFKLNDDSDKKTASYLITKKLNPFNGVFPK